MPGKDCLCAQSPIKTLGIESLRGSPGQKHHTHIAVFFTAGVIVSGVTKIGRKEHRKLAHGLLQIPTTSLSFMNQLCIFIMSLINLNCEHNYVPTSGNSSMESPSLGV